MSKLILGNDDLFPSILEERVLDDLIGFLGSFVGVQFCKGGGRTETHKVLGVDRDQN